MLFFHAQHRVQPELLLPAFKKEGVRIKQEDHDEQFHDDDPEIEHHDHIASP